MIHAHTTRNCPSVGKYIQCACSILCGVIHDAHMMIPLSPLDRLPLKRACLVSDWGAGLAPSSLGVPQVI